MTSSPPDEAIHFRGKTLTPESPRPLHIPEPSNIPVLKNQMDPVFNDTSTYAKSASKQEQELPYQSTPDSGTHQSVNNFHSRNEDGHTAGQEPESAHVPSTIDFQPGSLNSISPTELNAASYRTIESLANENSNSTNTTITQQNISGNGMNDMNASNNVTVEAGVDFQSLLDNISASVPTAPSGTVVTATTLPPSHNPILQQQQAIGSSSLPISADLPPRPPPQEAPTLHFDYSPAHDMREYHQILAQNSNQGMPSYAAHQQADHTYSNPSAVAPGVPLGTSSGANGLPPPPVATFQQQQSQQVSTLSSESASPGNHKGSRADGHSSRPSNSADDEAPWGPDVQKKYDEFLRDERVYVTEGLWDRFPPGSRLFVGNLPTERVTKRDLFHVFHKYGKLAQISIKQAYGFIQFLDATSCHQALKAEQGGLVRGRNIHLEISKPQKNRVFGPNQPDSVRAAVSRRSRSPEFTRGGSANTRTNRSLGGDRHDRSYDSKRVPFSDFRDEPNPRRRDEYRAPRSPSPRGFRSREGGFRSRDRTPDRFDRRDRRRSRSPYGRERRFRSPSPRGRPGFDGEPRRTPRDLPDLQILAYDDVDRKFVYHVESSFKNRGLRVDVAIESPTYFDSAIQREINDGVPAIIKLSRNQQYSGKVTLLICDRNAATSQSRPNEYPDLDLHAAVEIVVQAQSLRRAGVASNAYQSNIPFPVPPMLNQYPQPLPQPLPVNPTLSNPGQLASLISTLDGPSLQSLLGVLQQAQSAPQPTQQSIAITPNAANPVDLASLLSNATRQQSALPAMPSRGPHQPQSGQPFGLPMSSQAVTRPDPNVLALLAKGLGSGNQPQAQASVGSQVQNIVNQLSKWKQ